MNERDKRDAMETELLRSDPHLTKLERIAEYLNCVALYDEQVKAIRADRGNDWIKRGIEAMRKSRLCGDLLREERGHKKRFDKLTHFVDKK